MWTVAIKKLTNVKMADIWISDVVDWFCSKSSF
jgi:hypothetical protein